MSTGLEAKVWGPLLVRMNRTEKYDVSRLCCRTFLITKISRSQAFYKKLRHMCFSKHFAKFLIRVSLQSQLWVIAPE